MKWLVLAVYSVVIGLSQLLWLNFAPILTHIQGKYGVDETAASLLILVFPLIYVFLSIPAGLLIDRRGYRFGVGLGVILMTVFSIIRIYDSMFITLLVAQVGIAIAQPFVVNGISKLVLDWFDKEQGAIATGLGTMGMFIGMAVGLALTPILVAKYELSGAMKIFAIVSTVLCVLFFLVVKNNPNGKHKDTATATIPRSALKHLFSNKNLVIVFVIAFLGLGFFNGLTTWLELILAPLGVNSEQAGNIGGVLILGGIFGAAIVPALSDKFCRRKPFVIGGVVAAMATLYPLCTSSNYTELLIFAALQGFFFLPAFSLLLEMCSDLVGESLAGSATSILMLAGNAGGVLVIIAMDISRGGSPSFLPGVHLLFCVLMAAAILATLVKETHPKRGT